MITPERLAELIEQEATVMINGNVRKLYSTMGMFLAFADGLYIGEYFTDDIHFVADFEDIEEVA